MRSMEQVTTVDAHAYVVGMEDAGCVNPGHSGCPVLRAQVDREALRDLMRGALDAYVNLGPSGYYNYLDSFLALLSTEETQ
jgi:hypothetical protein